MLLTFKDLQQKKFTVDAEPSDTIKQVKEKIKESQGYDVDAQKLIYSGKILADDQTVESYKIQEKDFVVCMVKKPKPTSTASPAKPSTPTPTVSTPSVPASAPAPQPGAVPVPNPVTPATTTATSPPPAPQPAAVPAAFGDPNAFSVGGARENAIQQLMAMGFDRPDVERAMRAAFNNPDRAVEYLMDGIPAHLQTEAAGGPRSPPTAAVPATPSPAGPNPQAEQTQTSPTPQATTTTTTTTSPPGGPINLFEAAAQRAAAQRSGGAARGPAGTAPTAAAGAGAGGLTAGMGANFEALRSNPNFLQLRNIVQSNPQLLEPIIQNIAQANPQFAQLITQNPEAFLQLLAEGGEEGEEGGAFPPGAIQVTPEEAEAIGRLEALGFPRHMAIQAYIACDKNEEIAANYLFEHGFEDEDDDEAPAA